MASLKEIRTRISSVASTKQVTSAMKMVSAAKLRKAQDAIQQMRPYAGKLQEILSNISSSLDAADENVYAEKREVKKVLIVSIASNRGLCGAFNSNVVKKILELTQNKFSEQFKNGGIDVISIGKKAQDILKSRKIIAVQSHNDLYGNLSFENVAQVASEVMHSFTDKKYDHVELVYNRFKNAGSQILTSEQFLPIKVKADANSSAFNQDYIFEPSKEYIVNKLIPKSLKTQFFKAMLDSHASEHGARMTAMHMATDNADELMRELKLHYNKARQASITNEILEIVSGSEALRS